jgi:hypothetical protein
VGDFVPEAQTPKLSFGSMSVAHRPMADIITLQIVVAAAELHRNVREHSLQRVGMSADRNDDGKVASRGGRAC